MVHNPFSFLGTSVAMAQKSEKDRHWVWGTLWWREQLYDMGNRNGCRI